MNRRMNKDRKMRKRCSFRKHGGGLTMGAPLVPFNPAADQTFAVRVPSNESYSDCAFPTRFGQLYTNPQVALAQTPMAGGSRSCGCAFGSRGGRRTRRKTYKHKGGSNGYAISPSMSVGGNGPNVGALVAPVPCDIRSGSTNPFTLTPVAVDPRAPSDIYSLTSNQLGGSYGTGNGFSDDCYKAPGSSLPVYSAQTAGFGFQPSTQTGNSMPTGVAGYMTVVPQEARMGGSYKKRRQNKKRQSKRRN